MNKGFLQGTPFYIEAGSHILKTYHHKGIGVRITLSNNEQFICGIEQELFDYDNNIVIAKDSLNAKLYNGEVIINVEEVGEVDLFDITVSNEGHYFYIIINDCHVKVHNLNIGKYLGRSMELSNTKPIQDTTIYIPATTIQFTVSMLKPNTRLYAFFDGKDVTKYIKPVGLNKGDSLITDNNGYAAGDFYLPNTSSIRFASGYRELLLCDSPSGKNYSTSATATYIYTGNNDNPDNPNLDASSSSKDESIEPIIQSFICNETGGMFISRIGLYFYEKDYSQPILFQIREVVEDKVSSSYIAGTSLEIKPKDIITSKNALESEPTWIEFPNPVYLSEGKEYAIFMATNSSNYILHMVDYGQQTNNITATKDISSRSLMKYIGGYNYIRENSRGLKYKIDKCKFDTSNVYTLSLGNYVADISEGDSRLLPNNSLKLVGGENKVTVIDPNHSFSVGGLVNIECTLPADFGSKTSYAEGMITGQHRIIETTWDSYTFDNYYNGTIETKLEKNSYNEDKTLIFGSDIRTDYDMQYNNLALNINALQLTGTSLKYQVKGLSGKSLNGTEQAYVLDSDYTYVEPKTIYKPTKVKKISSKANSVLHGIPNNHSLQVVATLKTDNENISPIIDKYNANAIIVENLINNENSKELSNTNNDACARMIFKTVSLYEAAIGLRVNFNGAIQANSNVSVYYKIVESGENVSIDSKEWVKMPQVSDVAKSLSETDFQQYSYQVDELNPFKSFKIKLVMNSSDSSKVPLIKKFAAIAFAK